MFKTLLLVGMLFHHFHIKPVLTPQEWLLLQDAQKPKIDCNEYVLPDTESLRATCTLKT
jgi:hypothetical protein